MKELSNWLSAALAYMWFSFMWVMHLQDGLMEIPFKSSILELFFTLFVTRVIISVNKWQRNKLR